ncbi:hypothetical protein ARMGADRAFT_1100399 [Armillaria gallica]|uniref:non-specific serine/threonine protein kinase n=1 Tax=Armillaria gallica TaxID=47427 RepID=A0A2H3DEX4_ARMGA|nr:hypothetical protein ARMGADRAFT_1100399 [Armillaria gallica]
MAKEWAFVLFNSCFPHIERNILRSLPTAIDLGSERNEIAQRMLEAPPTIATAPLTQQQHNEEYWRKLLRTATEGIMLPETLDWMDDDDNMSDRRYIQRAIDDIVGRYSRPLEDTLTSYRLSVIDQLQAFCAFLRPDVRLSTVPLCVALTQSTLDGKPEEITTEVRKRAFKVITDLVKFHSFGDVEDLTAARQMIFSGMADTDRGVRLVAGRALQNFVLSIARMKRDASRALAALFSQLNDLADGMKLPTKDTIIISVGATGRTKDKEVLGHVLFFLLVQLGRSNPMLKAEASTHIISLTKYHKKATPYPLFIPYMDRIAPYLVLRISTQPSFLTEACRLMMVQPRHLIQLSLRYTLPVIFAKCDQKLLEDIAKHLESKPATLLINDCHRVLAHIYLLDQPDQTNKALTFVTDVLTAAAQADTIDIQSLVKGFVVPVLADLVIVLGDENPDVAAKAVPALKRVSKSLIPPSVAGRSQTIPDIGAFLKQYMLGLITHINEMLQEVHGKILMSAKQKILRSLGAVVSLIGSPISTVAPQIMATFQTMVNVAELSEMTLSSWRTFLMTLDPKDVGPYVGTTSATITTSWPTLTSASRHIAISSLEYMINDIGNHLGQYLDDIVDLSAISRLKPLQDRLTVIRGTWSPKEHLCKILARALPDNQTMAVQTLVELKAFMLSENQALIRELASGDTFDPMVGQILTTLLSAACRDGDGAEAIRSLAFECIGILGAVDPDRCEIAVNDTRMIVLSNYTDDDESVMFALHLITDLLVGAFRSTSDIKYQGHLAYSIQELLRFCRFTPSLVSVGNQSVPMKVRTKWNNLPKHVLETVTPLLEARFTLQEVPTPEFRHPIYNDQPTYREWIQLWTTYLITRASGPVAKVIFGVFRPAVRNKDVVVAHHLLPHLVLNVLVSSDEVGCENIRAELIAVLQDQVNPQSTSSADKRLLSAQAVFMLLDHLNKWLRRVRHDMGTKKGETKRSRGVTIGTDEQLLKVDSILTSIDQSLMARAAFQCRAYARSLMSFERQIVNLRERSLNHHDLPVYYDRLHEIYANLDEPDGMEGVSTLILSPSLEHQIRQHESTGRWTAAQSCWELRLQQSPDNVDFHLGLLRCLRNLGHYDTLRTHVLGVLTRNPACASALAGFQVESAWMVGDWVDVQNIVSHSTQQNPELVLARVLLAIRSGDNAAINQALSAARSILGAPIAAAGAKGYKRSYEDILSLHLLYELGSVHSIMGQAVTGTLRQSQTKNALAELSDLFSARLESTLPTFRTREPILSMRRTAFRLFPESNEATREIHRTWLASAKFARKACQWQTAFSAMLQAKQGKTKDYFMQSAKLTKANGEPLAALHELESSMKLLSLMEDDSQVLDLTVDNNEETNMIKAKARVLRARWMNESERYEAVSILSMFRGAANLSSTWENAHFYLGQFQDDSYKNLTREDQRNRGLKMNVNTVRSYARAIRHGSKYVYQTVPRLLTLWLDLGDDEMLRKTESFKTISETVRIATEQTPVYQWYTAFPQIVSRIGHSNENVLKLLSNLISKVLEAYPQQALWQFISVTKSKKTERERRGKKIVDKIRNKPTTHRRVCDLLNQCVAMTDELLALCEYPIDDNPRKSLSMSRTFPSLARLGQSDLIIPLQESLTANIPPVSITNSDFNPFPIDAPTFTEFYDDIEVMSSLAKPRKITIRGSNGQIYMFLGKPKDDLRKDARLMDFNAIINKLLKANSESRRRQLHIRTYGVVTLNEECGFIQWVPNTIPLRPILVKAYEARRIRSWPADINDIAAKIKAAPDKEAVEIFKARVLCLYPPVFHEWFIETFPEPSAWLTSRLTYGRTAAVMSMVGFILGLGDRHLENILMDINTGDVVHVDFNCLFEKGKKLETPERVPFRLTQNMLDGLGVTGVEGVFRAACDVTLGLLRDNKDSLMTVLDAFIHDPLVEWEDEKRKRERSKTRNQVKGQVNLRDLAQGALGLIERKLRGVYSTSKEKPAHQKEISTSNLVQMIIQEATDEANLAKMYQGWCSWQ